MDSMDSLVGRFASSRAGHDKSQIFVIVAEEEDFVFLCDGKCRTVSRPKKKRRKHIQLINKTVEDTLLVKLRRHEKATDEEIKRAVKLYQQQKQK